MTYAPLRLRRRVAPAIRMRSAGGATRLLRMRDGRTYHVPLSGLDYGLGFSLKPPRKIRAAFRKIKKAVTLKRVLAAGAIVGGAIYGGPLIAKAGGFLVKKAGGLIRGGGGAQPSEIPGAEVSAPIAQPVDYTPSPAPTFAAPGGGGGGGEDTGDEQPAAAGAGAPAGGVPTPLLIGGLILATVALSRAAGAARSRR